MAYHYNDNVYTKSFTPRESSIELFDSACERNIIACLSNASGKSFVATKLIQDVNNRIKSFSGIITLYIAESPTVVTQQAGCISRLTNLNVSEFNNPNLYSKKGEWKESIKKYQVLVLTTPVALMLFKSGVLSMAEVGLIILHGCHCVLKEDPCAMKEFMKFYYNSTKKPHILGLANSLFLSGLDPCYMEAEISKMEKILDCNAETASNVVSVLRYSTQPTEVVLECAQYQPSEIDELIENEIMTAMNFLKDHRYDPNEIYEGFMDEFEDIPDPTTEPKEIFKELLNVLHNLGPWCVDKAAFVLLLHIEKLKVTTPYERHFLLLCMASSVIIKIRAILDDFFKDIDEKDRIYKYSSQKILRTIEIIRKFQPEKLESDLEDFSDGDEIDDEDEELSLTELKPCDTHDISSNTKKSSNCNCELLYEYLLKRLDNPLYNNLSFNEFLVLLKAEKNCDNLIDDETDGEIDKENNESCENNKKSEFGLDEQKSSVMNVKNSKKILESELILKNLSSKKVINNVIQRKNGFVSIADHEKLKNDRKSHVFASEKVSDSHLHEYVLLPKFKVDRYARYDHTNSITQIRGVGREDFIFRKSFMDVDLQQLCGIIFVESKFTAKVLFHVLNDLKQTDEDFTFLNVHFTVEKIIDGTKDPKGAEIEHRKQELVLKRFRMRECNLLIGTGFLEEGIDLPKCNLVMRFNVPVSYRSYVHTKERARAADSLYCLLVDSDAKNDFVEKLAEFYEIEKILMRKCGNLEPPKEEERDADDYVELIMPFSPLMKEDCPHVDLSTSIALVNKYCAKLPSDTFTRLTPIWNVKAVKLYGREMYSCTIRLPINSPVKQEIEGIPMPTKVLARRFAALQCCQLLHLAGELDDTLQPITKESFWMREEEQLTANADDLEEMKPKDSLEPRPGTTKRRQYYYKRIADSLTDCGPVAGKPSFLYDISMALTCPLPEEQNTRGRKIHAPEDSLQGFGILTSKSIPKIGGFPIFTRSGEVQVKLELARKRVTLTESQVEKIVAFIHYTFTSVLRLQKYLMMFDPNSSENSYFVVPTKKGEGVNVEVDWEFLDLIFDERNQVPIFVPEEERKDFVFDSSKFEDAVVSPWYRNQDQPQYFYVAEICDNLTPKSAFPGTEYETFEEYYFKKYDIQIQNSTQSLLDVDHTSARLNFLTPRYVNRKGVALPTTSEEKKRAKRENLEQKQILVPELCNIHPFPATLWRKAVCLPCILHRINALLLADEVRRIVALNIGIGVNEVDEDFDWKPLDFGWSLADVLNQSKASQKHKEEETEIQEAIKETKDENYRTKTEIYEVCDKDENDNGDKNAPWMEIGTWSNEMADAKPKTIPSFDDSDELDSEVTLPGNVTMIDRSTVAEINGWCSDVSPRGRDVRYGSPTSWMGTTRMLDDDFSDYLSDDSYSDDYYDDSESDESEDDSCGLKIEFTGENVAEAVEDKATVNSIKDTNEDEEEPWPLDKSDINQNYQEYLNRFESSVTENKEKILNDGIFYDKDETFDFSRPNRGSSPKNISDFCNPNSPDENWSPFGSSANSYPRLIDEIPEKLQNLPVTELIVRSLKDHEEVLTNRFNDGMSETLNLVNNGRYEDDENDEIFKDFSFDEQPDLSGHPGPSPSLILQGLTMSNANDGINLERLETIGDSFLKYAITTYLYCTYENVHEGKLSHLRSKQVSNFNLYRLGRRKKLGESMIATKFEPHDNWLPPCYYVPRELERALIEAGVPASHWNRADLPTLRNLSREEICKLVREKGEKLGIVNSGTPNTTIPSLNLENMPCFIPYNLMTQHSIPDKSIADCVEALIGAYLVACGPRGALLFMSWLGIKVLPKEVRYSGSREDLERKKIAGCTEPVEVTNEDEVKWSQTYFGDLKPPKPPLLRFVPDPEGELERFLKGFEVFEDSIKYHFRDRSYLLQALTHASYSPNRLTDCYQRLEFLGDAVLDYLITRHLYEDPRHHSPGALTDLRSALVNNTIFASLAVRHNFHRYFRHLCPGLNEVIDRFVRIQQENNHSISEEFYYIEEDECEEAEDVEVPKALGDVFESVAGAIFLDSGMSLDAVWRVYYRIMRKEIELFSTNVPKSPIRELFELEPETAQFGKPEKLADGRRVRVTVEVFGKGIFNGIGRNYRIAKCTAAKCALKQLKRKGLLERRK